MNRVIALFVLVLMSLGVQGQYIDGTVAVVGRNIVLKSDVQVGLENFRQQGFSKGDNDECLVLENLLLEKLLIHQAELDSIEVSDEEVEETIDRRLQAIIAQMGSERKFLEYYKKSPIEVKEELRPVVHDQLVAQRMQEEITKDVKITPAEVRAYYLKFPKDSLPLINEELEFSQLVKYPEVSEEAKAEAIRRLNELKERISKGSSFSTMAVLYSEDPGSAKNGGEYKGIKRGQFVKEFEAVAFNLKKGEVSDPFRSEFGYHIVQVLERRGEELDLRHILIKPKFSQADLLEAKTTLDSIYAAIQRGELTFERACELFSDDEETKYNGGAMINEQTGDLRWEVGQIEDRMIFLVVDKLEENQVSQPDFFRRPDGKEGYRLIKLNKRIEPHRASLETDYSRLQMAAQGAARQEKIDEWVKKTLVGTYVRINQELYPCQFRHAWNSSKTP
jgi:peptidyl-prolyl cis-trans isomerase SurA